MKKMSFKNIFNWLYGATLDRVMHSAFVSHPTCTRLAPVSHLSRFCLASLILIVVGGWNTQAWGDDCTYTYSRDVYTTSINNGEVIAQYSFTNSYGLVSFSYKLTLTCTAAGADLTYKIQYLPSNSNTWEDTGVSTSTLNGTWQAWRSEDSENKTVTVSSTSPIYNARGIRIVSTKDFGTHIEWFKSVKTYRTVSVSDVSFKMAKTLSGSEETMTFDNQTYNTTSSAKTREFTFSNEVTGKSITISENTNSTEFPATLTQSGVCTGSVTVSVTFKPSAQGDRSGSITVSGDCGSKTFSVSGTGLRANSSLEMNDGEENVSIAGINSSPLDLSTLLKSKTGNGGITYKVQSATGENATTSTASIAADGKTFSATECGTYTIRATQAQTDQYNSSYDDFTVTVNKLQPTFTWKSFDHIYAGDVLENLAQAQYNGANVAGLTYAYSSNNLTAAVPVESNTKISVPTTGFTTNQDVRISVTTAETDYYKGGSSYKDYLIEPKATPRFLLNGEDLPAEPVKELRLLIGETATMAFENTDESNGRFSYPIAAQYISYNHNSSAHTGTITAIKYGDEGIQFHQTGTTTIFDHTRSIHVYVKKHEVSLSSPLAGITCEVGDSVETSGVYSLSAIPAEGQPAQRNVIISSDNEGAVKFAEGKWRAVGEGTAVLTIAQENNDFWTGDTITATITVNKKTPAFTWMLPATSNFNREYTQPVISTNTDEGCTFTYTSDNMSAIRFENGALNTYEVAANNVAVTVKQKGNYKWKDHSETFYVNIQKLPNHLPLTINSSEIYNAVRGGTQGEVAFQDGNVIRLGGSDRDIFHAPAYNKDDKYIDIAFDGIPAQISFDLAVNQKAATGEYWYVKQKANKNDAWSGEIWHCEKEGENFEHFGPINLDKDTRYVRLCYSGNFAGLYKDVTITELKKIEAPETVGFGSSYIGNAATEKTIDVNWYNVKSCTVTLSGANADCFELVDNSIASTLDHYGTAGIRVRYKHDIIGTHTATLTITSADEPAKTATVTLTGETKKAIQSIIWREDITPLPLSEPYSGAAYATSGLNVTLTAETPGILEIEGDRVTGVGVGTTRLIASQAGDTKWEAVNETITVEVTNKHVQHIIWTDRLSNVKRENGQTVTKTLTAYSDADNTLPITYELDATASDFASVSGNTLTITGWGTGYITARQAGNDDYVGVSKTMKLVSRDPNADCKPLVLDEAGVKTLHTIDSEEFTLQGEPATIEFDAKVNQLSALYGIWVGEYYGGSWHEVKQVSRSDMSQNYQHFGPYKLHINATKVKIYTETGTTWQRDFKNVEVTLAKYLELQENNMDFSAVEYGQVVDQEFYITYSNLSGTLEVSLANPSEQFQILTETVGEDCGEVNHNAQVRVRFTGHTMGTENNTIILQNRDQRLEVPVSATVTKASQVITWEGATSESIQTTDDVTLSAVATSSLPVAFVSSDNTIAETYDKGDGTWGLTIHKAGEITVTASQAGSDRYNAAPAIARTYIISRVTPEITALPIASSLVLPNVALSFSTLAEGVASVEGSFAWQDENIHASFGNNTYTAVFTPANTDWYNIVNCQVEVLVTKATQEITWDFSTLEMYCNANYTFDATASSGLNVRYTSSDPTIAYVDDANQLRIIKGGEVTITAHQDGNDTYAAAAVVNKTLTINRFTPEIVTLPTAQSMLIGHLLSDASLTGGSVKLDGVEVEGSFAWEDGNTRVETEAGVFERTVIFTPANTNWYNTVSDEMNVVVEKYAPAVYPSLTGSTITYGQPLSYATISGTIIARDEIKYPQEDVQGTYAWKRPDEIVNAGSPSYATVVFTPDNLDWYKTVEFNIPLTVLPAELQAATATSQIFYGQILSEATLTNTTYGVIDGGTALISGTLEWDDNLDMMHYYDLGTHTLPIVFTPNDPNYKPIPVAGTATLTVTSGFVFNGTDNTNWEKSENWLDNNKPTDSNDKVVILSNVDITGEVEVEAMTIRDGVTVTIKDGATLTLGNDDSYFREQYGDVKVEQGGKLILNNGTLDVNNLYIASAIGGRNTATQEFVQASSAQVENIELVNIHANVFFDLALDPSGECSQGWYDFTVPFEVDVMTGIARFDNTTHELKSLTQGVNYAVITYDEARHASGVHGWKKFTGTMVPGKGYSMTIDDVDNVYRFTRKTGTNIISSATADLDYSETGAATARGWNAIGNGSLTYANAQTEGISYVQIYNHVTNAYTGYGINDVTFVVGGALFVQTPQANRKMNFSAANTVRDELRAPTRNTTDKFTLEIAKEGVSTVADRLFVAASEYALDEYQIGRDVAKFGTPNEANVAQLWVNAYNVKLCAVDAPLTEGNAFYDLGLYAPTTGNYVLDIVDAPNDATLYLTYDGTVIWNLSESAYTLSLMKGTTANYGLQLVREARNAATGVEQVGSETQLQKFVHNGVLYINKDGVLYDAMGKKVK